MPEIEKKGITSQESSDKRAQETSESMKLFKEAQKEAEAPKKEK